MGVLQKNKVVNRGEAFSRAKLGKSPMNWLTRGHFYTDGCGILMITIIDFVL
jgi:hypothetical protein